MKYYLAPLEGITDHIYRRTYHKLFEPMDKYFIPFLTPNENGKLSKRQRQDVLPENNEGMYAVPQILTNKTEEFLSAEAYLGSLGYEEINLNLGCPSRCVVSKGRGAGFLADPDGLRRFLDEIFEKSNIRISIKSRIGVRDVEEFGALLDLYNQYPLEELILHPRTGKEFYKGSPHRDVYRYAMKESRHPLCYNGDLFTKEQYEDREKKFPQSDAVMLGRGILGDPLLLSKIKQNHRPAHTWMELQYELYLAYQKEIQEERHVLSRLKEFWTYRALVHREEREMIQKIYRTNTLKEYAELLHFE